MCKFLAPQYVDGRAWEDPTYGKITAKKGVFWILDLTRNVK